MDDIIAKLEADFCPPLDPALLSAIVWDYDLQSETGLADARTTLTQLRESALTEEAAEFDPSGTGGHHVATNDKQIESSNGSPVRRSHEASVTDVSDALSSLSVGSASEPGLGQDIDPDDFDEETKLLLLHDVLGEQIDSYTIQHTLRKCNGHWNATFGELLNHVHIREAASEGEEYTFSKGVDGFAETYSRRGRKNKGKNRKFKSVDERRSTSVPSPPEEEQNPALNKWQMGSKDIDFVVTRTGIDVVKVKSAYYSHEANLSRTINALLKQYMQENKTAKLTTDDDTIAANALALGYEFPSLDPHYLAALVRVTHPSTASAFDLAEALTNKPSKSSSVQVIPQYSRPLLDTPATTPKRPLYNPYVRALSTQLCPAQYALARDYARSQALSARKHPGASGYYTSLATSHSVALNAARSTAFSQLAASQSTATSVDLHGVDVANGVRIALERVGNWWETLGEARVNGRAGASARGGGYEVIVGKGTHSEGGKAKLGPAVSVALRREGWRVENEGGVLRVRGRR